MRRIMAAVLAAAISLGVASCGGEKQALTKAQFVARAEVVCRSALKGFMAEVRNAHIEKLARAQQAAVGAKLMRVTVDKELAGLKALTPPTELQSTFAAYQGTLASRLDLQLQELKERGTIAAYAEQGTNNPMARKQERVGAAAARLRRQLGLKGCN